MVGPAVARAVLPRGVSERQVTPFVQTSLKPISIVWPATATLIEFILSGCRSTCRRLELLRYSESGPIRVLRGQANGIGSGSYAKRLNLALIVA
jgi:hypothetical protein